MFEDVIKKAWKLSSIYGLQSRPAAEHDVYEEVMIINSADL